jgi:hypothetical protein
MILHAFLIPLVDGAILAFAVLGVGKFTLRLLSIPTLPWYWHAAFLATLGQATVNLSVQSLLLSGGASAPRLRILGWFGIAVGLSGHLLAVRRFARQHRPGGGRTDNFLKALFILIWLTNLAVALAPSSKIDEVFYHMLVPKRIVADGTMNFYRLPIEAAIVPQMQYQISLSPAYALGAPEAGNVLSLSYSIVLGLFIIGFIRDATGNDSLALLCGLGCVVGVYQTVWHTTGAPTAIGELALAVAVCGVLWPESLMLAVKPLRYGLLIVTAASLAASTKISLLPLCIIISFVAGWKTSCEKKDVKSPLIMGIVLLPWAVMHLPLMVWTYHQSGSFWGPVMANIFRPSIFPAAMLRILDQMRVINQVGLLTNMRFAIVELSPLIFLGIGLTLWGALRVRGGNKAGLIIISFLLFQGGLILWRLPYDFRFLGGLLYIPLIAAVLMLTGSKAKDSQPPGLTPHGKRVVELRNWIALGTVVPWLVFQMYYARPFAQVALGLATRNQFRERFVALTHDYEVLNRILPPDAVLYVANGRVSLFDAPRSVVLTPLDLRQRTSIYRLTIKDLPEKEAFETASVLNCDEIVYLNSRAVVETYRTPGLLPKIGTVTVRKCRIEAARPSSNISAE